MFVRQFFVKGIAHSSYLLGGAHACAIIDPQRDVAVYLQAAEEMGLSITHVLQTHLHADFISGHLDLAETTGATIYAPASAECRFPHTGLTEGDTVEFEHLKLSVLETPGHTPEHVSYVATDTGRGEGPVSVFCGDTLFVGDVGRPDLFPGRAQELASALYDSLHHKLLKLPDHVEVYPAHGAGSLCGRAMAAKRTSTIGYERLHNPALQIADLASFVDSLTTNMPAAPDHFSRCSAENGAGPALVRDLPVPRPLPPQEFSALARSADSIVLDTREYDAFGGAHVPGAFNISAAGNFATFAGWLLPVGRDILLVSNEPRRDAQWLWKVGLDRTVGYLEGGMFAYGMTGLPIQHVTQVSARALHEQITAGEPMALVDVRSPEEYSRYHIKGSVNIPLADVRTRYGELDPNLPTAVICGSGQRSSIGCSLLLQRGFEQVLNVAGGMSAYAALGLAPRCPFCVGPHGPRYLGDEEQ